MTSAMAVARKVCRSVTSSKIISAFPRGLSHRLSLLFFVTDGTIEFDRLKEQREAYPAFRIAVKAYKSKGTVAEVPKEFEDLLFTED